ncbi:MAG TPA: hypothetical protein VMI75_00175 [Polyangiaceae bacterium]|nr:hypothetical protein [Polyangiaceae bacterium]
MATLAVGCITPIPVAQKATLTGLPAGTTVQFRYRSISEAFDALHPPGSDQMPPM